MTEPSDTFGAAAPVLAAFSRWSDAARALELGTVYQPARRRIEGVAAVHGAADFGQPVLLTSPSTRSRSRKSGVFSPAVPRVTADRDPVAEGKRFEPSVPLAKEPFSFSKRVLEKSNGQSR
jgi:hypothetical protein